MYEQLELPNEVDTVNAASNDTANDSDICNIMEEEMLILPKKVIFWNSTRLLVI